ncbi:MAG: ankyrin repeat domain-containing protein [Deltaproteobacteria bacterium]|nr:ankyrin repeat domain-containing protein [Deltaproteobacteria bacterium]
MTKTKKTPSRLRILTARALVLVLLLAAAVAFGSQTRVTCQRTNAHLAGLQPTPQVQCQVIQDTQLPFTNLYLPIQSQEVLDLREAFWNRRNSTRSPSQRDLPSQTYDVLILVGKETIEVSWRDALGPINSFLKAPHRTEMVVSSQPDPRGWLVSWVLLLLAGLTLIDSAIILVFGQHRIAGWIGKAPNPDEPLPDTFLARVVGPAGCLLIVAAGLLFAFFGYRFVGPYAEHKVAALHSAAASGDLEALDRALDRGVSVEATEESGLRTALFFAIQSRSSEAVVRLLEAGANPNATDLSGTTPLHLAASLDNASAQALLDSGAVPDSISLCKAAAAGQTQVVTALLDAGVSVEDKDPQGWSPLHHAAASNRAPVARILLASGADPGARNDAGRLAWDLAFHPGSEVREMLPRPEPRGDTNGSATLEQTRH